MPIVARLDLPSSLFPYRVTFDAPSRAPETKHTGLEIHIDGVLLSASGLPPIAITGFEKLSAYHAIRYESCKT